MPELPDVVVYVEAIAARVVGARLAAVRLGSPFLVRSVDPPLAEAIGLRVRGVERLGKRIVIGLERELALAIHLMVAGRLHWRPPGAALARKVGLAALEFDEGPGLRPGALTLTEAGSKRRASLHVVRGTEGLRALDRGGLEVLEAEPAAFAAALRRERHTLKRALTDPGLFSGIGGAYSDEILHRARLSPLALTSSLDDADAARLHAACRAVLLEWCERLRREAGGGFPERVTAFRPEMAVHGRFGHECPACGAPVQRIRYADNETNYCPRCQTGGRILADRALSRLLREDWPRSLDELEERR
jgi:formamidopyrimidine-DNA glycosylase